MADQVQMSRIDETRLVRRAGGKNVRTQLNKSDPEIVVEINVKGNQLQKPAMHYVDAQLRGAFYQALAELYDAAKNKPKLQLEVLRDTAKIHLNEKYKPILWIAEGGKMDMTKVAKDVDLGQLKEQDAVTMLVNAIDKKTKLNPEQVNNVFDVLGADVKVEQKQVKPLVEQLQTQGILANEDVKDFQSKVKHSEVKTTDKGDVKGVEITKFISTRVQLRPDFTLASKKVAEDAQGYVTFRHNVLQSVVGDKTFGTTRRQSKATNAVTVNMDERTDRTRVDFRTVDARIDAITK